MLKSTPETWGILISSKTLKEFYLITRKLNFVFLIVSMMKLCLRACISYVSIYSSGSSINGRPYLSFLLTIHRSTSTFLLSFKHSYNRYWNYLEPLPEKTRTFHRIITKNGKRKYFTVLKVLLTYIIWVIPKCHTMGWSQSPDSNFNTPRWNDRNKDTHHSLTEGYAYLVESSIHMSFLFFCCHYILPLLMMRLLNKEGGHF